MTIALRRPVAVVHAGALFVARAGTNPRTEASLRGKRRCGRANFGDDLLLKELQLLECQFQELSVHGLEDRARAERIAQLFRCST